MITPVSGGATLTVLIDLYFSSEQKFLNLGTRNKFVHFLRDDIFI